MKNVQIPYELFVSLLRYHLMEDDDCLNKIRQGLEQKLDSLVLHELYAKYKTAPTQEEREKPNRNIWKNVECRMASAGSFPLMITDRSVSRSCG
mgnify:CR=1 FL=1